MVFRFWADDGHILVVLRFSLLKKTVVRVGPPLAKLSGSVHVVRGYSARSRPVCNVLTTENTYLHVRHIVYEPVHDISINVVCATSKASDQPVQTCSLIRAFAGPLSILSLFSY